MRNIINQIYYEGIGKSIYEPIENIINSIKNNYVRDFLLYIIRFLYLLLIILIAIFLFYISYPFK